MATKTITDVSEIDLKELDIKDLKTLRKKTETAIKNYDARSRKLAKREVSKLATKYGFKLDELVADASTPAGDDDKSKG